MENGLPPVPPQPCISQYPITSLVLTPTERRFLTLLSDGQPHRWKALVELLYDAEQGTFSNVKPHLITLRRKLRGLGLDVLVQYIKTDINYRLVALLS